MADETYPKLHELLRPLSDNDIDRAIQAWNGKIESKTRRCPLHEKHGREKIPQHGWPMSLTAATAKPCLRSVQKVPNGTALPWPKVQRRIAQLIKEERFYTQAEQDNLDDVDPVAIRETLAQRGIVDGQVVNPEKLDSDPFVQQVMADAQRIAAEETPEQPTPPDLSDQPITRTGTLSLLETVNRSMRSTLLCRMRNMKQSGRPSRRKAYDPSHSNLPCGRHSISGKSGVRITELRGGTQCSCAHRHELPHLPC